MLHRWCSTCHMRYSHDIRVADSPRASFRFLAYYSITFPLSIHYKRLADKPWTLNSTYLLFFSLSIQHYPVSMLLETRWRCRMSWLCSLFQRLPVQATPHWWLGCWQVLFASSFCWRHIHWELYFNHWCGLCKLLVLRTCFAYADRYLGGGVMAKRSKRDHQMCLYSTPWHD